MYAVRSFLVALVPRFTDMKRRASRRSESLQFKKNSGKKIKRKPTRVISSLASWGEQIPPDEGEVEKAAKYR